MPYTNKIYKNPNLRDLLLEKLGSIDRSSATGHLALSPIHEAVDIFRCQITCELLDAGHLTEEELENLPESSAIWSA
jgi:hypothetical protein